MEFVDEVMTYLHADEADKENIINLIADGHNVLQSHCGKFKMDDYPESKALIKDYVRFAWNGASEHFFDSFFEKINQLRWSVVSIEPPDEVNQDA
ncbi:hypothetical protein [Facklamia sp. P12950]|uniref:hypothetical protein n=1 Tax=Facklamia sp. P12950 TaxID=3421951 RepID=UPI003D16DF2F